VQIKIWIQRVSGVKTEKYFISHWYPMHGKKKSHPKGMALSDFYEFAISG
jgi:hypothetical protein